MKIPKELITDALCFSSPEELLNVPNELTVEQFSLLYVDFHPEEAPESDPKQEITWVWDLMFHMCRKAPVLALECVVNASRQPITEFQASCISAGALEDIIADHGPDVIDRIEALANESARFRYMLSGVWPRGQDKAGEIWQRVLRAREPGPDMDQGAPVPPADL
ncbi:DUF6869 domain-containing protein [Tabrizicola sp.]|uniref:DUF6869 domain-containing protein n=1 Tax=Tabrizicola sp. TaxID=2005166 RepID=UPI003F35168E